MEGFVEVSDGQFELLYTIRMEYQICCRLCPKPLYFYSTNDFAKHWLHHMPNLTSLPNSSNEMERNGLRNIECSPHSRRFLTILIDKNSGPCLFECNVCKEHNIFGSMEIFIKHLLDNHQNRNVIGDCAINNEFARGNELVCIANDVDHSLVGEETRYNESVDIKEAEQIINSMEYNHELDSIDKGIGPIDPLKNEVFPNQNDSLEFLNGNERSKDLSSAQLSCKSEISNVRQVISIEETQEIDNQVESENLTNSYAEDQNMESSLIDNKNNLEQTHFGEKNSGENEEKMNVDSKANKTDQNFYFGNESTMVSTKSIGMSQYYCGKNIFGENVKSEKLNLNVPLNENSEITDREVPESKIPDSISLTSNEMRNASNQITSNLEITSIDNEIDTASTSASASIYSPSRPNPPSSAGRKRKLKSMENEFDGDYSQSNFRRGRKLFKSSRDPISCPICSKFFSQMHSYNFHMKKFHPPTHCTLCDIDFKNTKSILEHLNSHRNEVNCPICHQDDSWCNKAHLKKHFHLLNCRKCDFFTTDEMELQTHQTICGQFCCDMCNSVFGDARAFRRHASSIHQNNEPFECTYCGQKFKFLNVMRMHQRTCQYSITDKN